MINKICSVFFVALLKRLNFQHPEVLLNFYHVGSHLLKKNTSVSTTGFPPWRQLEKPGGLRSATWHFHLDDFGSLATYEEMGYRDTAMLRFCSSNIKLLLILWCWKPFRKEFSRKFWKKVREFKITAGWWWFIVSKDEGCRWRMVRIRTKQILLFAVMGGDAMAWKTIAQSSALFMICKLQMGRTLPWHSFGATTIEYNRFETYCSWLKSCTSSWWFKLWRKTWSLQKLQKLITDDCKNRLSTRSAWRL